MLSLTRARIKKQTTPHHKNRIGVITLSGSELVVIAFGPKTTRKKPTNKTLPSSDHMKKQRIF